MIGLADLFVTRKRALVLFGTLAVLVAGVTWSYWRHPETTAAMRGETLARQYGCFGCHGSGGRGGVADPLSSAGMVPSWGDGTAAMYVRSRDEIREWILYGGPQSSSDTEAETETLIPMPSYDATISSRELDDLVAYFVAVSGWAPEIPEPAYEGRKVASGLGCFGCHGPSASGGVTNPASLRGFVPPLTGDEFSDLVRSDEELRAWILDGRIARLWNNPLARFFLERQTIQMPAYRDHLSDGDLGKLIAYIHWLREQ
jgi:mono/diheme cytochrome c family protein